MEYYISNLSEDGPSLYHHGRKGMKWGQHIFGKERKSSGVFKAKKAISKKPEPNVKKAFNGDKKNISKASDEELSAYLKRMQLEKQVLLTQKEMTALTTPPKKVSAGKRFVSAVWKNMLYPGIKDGAREAGKSVVKALADDMIKKAMEKKAADK